MEGCPFKDQRHGSPRKFSPEDREGVDLEKGFVFSVFGIEMRRAVVIEILRITIPKNRVTSGISSSILLSRRRRPFRSLKSPEGPSERVANLIGQLPGWALGVNLTAAANSRMASSAR